MPFPYVAVTLPDDTPPAYVAGLLSACSQAYPQGGCRSGAEGSAPPPHVATSETDGAAHGSPAIATREPAPTSPPRAVVPDSPTSEAPVILANVSWPDSTTATLLLGLPHWGNHRWLERSLTFKEQDQPLERYRALGFTVGSLAVTVSEVARLEQEAHQADTLAAPTKTSPASETTAAAAPRQKPAAAPPPEDDAPPGAADPVTVDITPVDLSFRGTLAGEIGEGFSVVRRGAAVGLGLSGESWGVQVNGSYTDVSGGLLTASLAGAEAALTFQTDWQYINAQLYLGGGYHLLSARVTKQSDQAFPSGVFGVNLTQTHWSIAPFLGLGARFFDSFTTDVPELGTLGTFSPFVMLGVVARASLSSKP